MSRMLINRSVLAIVAACMMSVVASAGAAEEITFNKHVASIVWAHCVKCHRPGEVAPFSLTSYQDTAKRAELIAEVVARHAMPPWKPVAELPPFSNGRRLTDAEVGLIRRWAQAGAPEGAAKDLPPLPKFAEGWQLGKPDLILAMPEAAKIPADGRDIYLNVLLPLKVPTGKYVRAIEFHPGNRRIVHHAVLFYDTSGKAREHDAADPALGFRAGSPPGKFLPGTLAIWTPGRNPLPLGDGLAMAWPDKADLVLNLHLHPSGKPETELSTLGVYFTDVAPKRTLVDLMLIDRKIDIAPGEKNFRTHDEKVLPADAKLVSIFPHMHVIGKEIKIAATYPDGRQETLFLIDDWDFNWQDAYEYAKPILLPRGTKLTFDAVHDNSTDNPQNPNNPPVRVRWGEQTYDEMSLAFLNLEPVGGGGGTASDLAMKPKNDAKPADYTERARAAIKKIDLDGNGRLSFPEVFAAVGNKHPKETVEKLLTPFDNDGDRELNLTETASALRVLQP
ncbi:MAG: ascorbate-dependent monooxygenase [Planctomycetia bacterium]|nr:ascorbate-dependent monooxygenase [Planctomycetia bacterium]